MWSAKNTTNWEKLKIKKIKNEIVEGAQQQNISESL